MNSASAASPRRSVVSIVGGDLGAAAAAGSTSPPASGRKPSAKLSAKAEKEAQQRLLEQQQRDRQSRIVASTFANMELAMMQQTFDSTSQLHAEAQSEVERLKEELEARDRDALEVVDFLRNDATSKAAKVKELELKLDAFEAKKASDEQMIRRRYEAIIKEKEGSIREAEEHISKLSEELDAAAQYQIERSELMLALDNAKAKQKHTIEHYEQELNRVKFAAVEERVRLQALEAEMGAKFRAEVEERSMAIAKLTNARVHEANGQLSKDRSILEQEVDALVKLSNSYRAQIEEMHRDQKVSEDVHAHTMKEAVALKLKMHDADSQRRYAEAERVETLEAFRREYAAKEALLESKVELLQRELEESQRAQRLQGVELARMRKLSSTIVSGRSGLEQFFHAAIAEIQKQQVLAITQSKNTAGCEEGAPPLDAEEDRTFLTSANSVNGNAMALTIPTLGSSGGGGGSSGHRPLVPPAHLQKLLWNEPSAARVQLLTGDHSARRSVVSSGGGLGTRPTSSSSTKGAMMGVGGVGLDVGGYAIPPQHNPHHPLLPLPPPTSPRNIAGGVIRGNSATAAKQHSHGHSSNGYAAQSERTLDPRAYYNNHAADARMLASASRREMLATAGRSGGVGSEQAPALSPLPAALPLPTAQAFEAMPWADKALIVKGMLRYMNAVTRAKDAAGAGAGAGHADRTDPSAVDALAAAIIQDEIRMHTPYAQQQQQHDARPVTAAAAVPTMPLPKRSSSAAVDDDDGVAWACERKGSVVAGVGGKKAPAPLPPPATTAPATGMSSRPSTSAAPSMVSSSAAAAAAVPLRATPIQQHVFAPRRPTHHHQPSAAASARSGSALSSMSGTFGSGGGGGASSRPATRGAPVASIMGAGGVIVGSNTNSGGEGRQP